MPDVSMAQLALIGEHLGHPGIYIREGRRGLIGHCGCGFNSRPTVSEAAAEQALADHISHAGAAVLRRATASGRNTESLIASLTEAAS